MEMHYDIIIPSLILPSLAKSSMEITTQNLFCYNCAKSLQGKHHVVVQYMPRWMKYPLPPHLDPLAWTPLAWTPLLLAEDEGDEEKMFAWLVEDKEDKEESMTLLARDFTLQLPWALLLILFL